MKSTIIYTVMIAVHIVFVVNVTMIKYMDRSRTFDWCLLYVEVRRWTLLIVVLKLQCWCETIVH